MPPNLNIDADFPSHPKTVRLVGLLGRGAEVLPIRLWCYCGKYHYADGRLSGYSEQEIESLAGWWGKAGSMLEAMLKVGYMDRDADGWFMVGWQEHQGHIVALKRHGSMMARKRWGKFGKPSNADSILPASPQQCSYLTSTIHTESRGGRRLHGIPSSVEEVIAYGQTINPNVDEQTCRAFWAFYEGIAKTNESGDVFWVTSGERGATITNWKAKLPSFEGKNHHATNQPNRRPSVDRNEGTLNAGTAAQYGKLAAMGKVSVPRGPAT